MIALSFVQHVSDVRAARAVLSELGKADDADHREARAAAGDRASRRASSPRPTRVMVARGDLGLEVPLERVPRLQKEITRRARALGRPVIVATQVLESMRKEPRPTRAEVSDAANAVDDGVDAIMLAGETASGAFPVESVRTLDAIIREAEQLPPLAVVSERSLMHAEHGRALCEAAVTLADRGQASAIVAVTRGGNTARMLATFRPAAIDPRGDAIGWTSPAGCCFIAASCPWSRSLAIDVDATGDAVGRELVSPRAAVARRRGRVRERARGPAAAARQLPEAASPLSRGRG